MPFKPFYLRSKDKFALGEICVCGHLKEDHGSRTILVRQSHEGSCCCTGCECKNFTFSRYATEDDFGRDGFSPDQNERLGLGRSIAG